MKKEIEFNGLVFHHVELLVDSIDDSIEHYSVLFGEENVSKKIRIDSQKVNVCFVKISPENYLELVEPTGSDSVVSRLLKKNVSYYHIGYKVEDISAAVFRLEQLNYKPLEFFSSEAFDGKKCIFLFSPQAHLIELIEK